jgi:hypothetical protein
METLSSAPSSPIRLTDPWTKSRVREFLDEARIPMRLAANTDSGFPIAASKRIDDDQGHCASDGMPGRLQRLADATVWPRLFGNCHMHRDTEGAIIDAGFDLGEVASTPPRFMRMVHGRAVRPAPTAGDSPVSFAL